jgi:hypothetical protein
MRSKLTVVTPSSIIPVNGIAFEVARSILQILSHCLLLMDV